ncbi:nitroreductase family protein [Sulfurimonas sp. HSL3-7]|uniref:nitroreductase family protein n=1 Tax=Sulfonitrofixus jiaomeiensis TaxID=3131938 RepID=UPI0031FA2236
MHEAYDATALTPMRVARLSGYIDWASQPSVFKHYPEFLFRYPFGTNPALRRAELSRMVTFEGVVGSKPYLRLNTPSAGNLHPVELYVQIRGVKGVLSGIYHVDAGANAMVLIREIERDGLEPALGMQKRFEGMLFVVSVVPFRSEWKYGDRALRYCYMDAGHQVGAVCASAAVGGHTATILSGFDADCLNRTMGFGGQEFAAAAVAIGQETERDAEAMKGGLMEVAPTDYCDTKGTIALQIAEEPPFASRSDITMPVVDETSIIKRRSARLFSPEPLETAQFEHFMHCLMQPPKPLESFAVVLQSKSLNKGVYKEGELLKEGDFADRAAALLVDQRFVKDGAVIMVFTAETFGSGELISAGLFAQRLYLEAAAMDAGFTGIGAFYDKKLQTFLGTQQAIVYVGVLGVERT